MGTHYYIEWLLWSAVIVIVYKMKVKCNMHEGNERLYMIATRVEVVVVVVVVMVVVVVVVVVFVVGWWWWWWLWL